MTHFLLLRGLTRDHRHWNEFPNYLQNQFPSAQIHFLDLPGTGTQNKRPSPWNIQSITADLQQQWKSLGSPNPCHLITISLGSMVGLQWVADHPNTFQSLTIINSSGGNLSAPWQRLNWKIIPQFLKIPFAINPSVREKIVLQLTTSQHHNNNELANQWGQYFQKSPLYPSTAFRQISAALRFKTPPKISIPLYVFNSNNDRLTHPSCSQKLADFYHTKLTTHPTAGHDLPLDDPQWLSEKIYSNIIG